MIKKGFIWYFEKIGSYLFPLGGILIIAFNFIDQGFNISSVNFWMGVSLTLMGLCMAYSIDIKKLKEKIKQLKNDKEKERKGKA